MGLQELLSSHREVFCKKGVLRNFAKFTRKHRCQSLFFNKVAGPSLHLYLKKTQHRCFPVNFAYFLRKSFFNRTPPVAASVLWKIVQDCKPSSWPIPNLNDFSRSFCGNFFKVLEDETRCPGLLVKFWVKLVKYMVWSILVCYCSVQWNTDKFFLNLTNGHAAKGKVHWRNLFYKYL